MRKQLEKNDADYDFSNVQGMGNHQQHRSKSLSTHNNQMDDGRGGSGYGPDSSVGLAALYGGGGGTPGGRMPNDYSMHAAHHQQQSHHQLLSAMLPGGPGGGGNQEQNLNMNQHSRSPSLKVRRYSFLAGSRRGRGFSEIFNSTILNDHFDQYTAADSGIGGRDGLGGGFISSSTTTPLAASNYGNGTTSSTAAGVHHARSNNPHYGNHNPRLRQPSTNPSPDSGVSDSMMDEDAVQKNRALQRRRTMPCIVDPASGSGEGVDSPAASSEIAAAKQQLAERETAISSENLSKQNPETFIIENGIRKRIRAEVHANPNRERRQLPKEYVLSDADPSGATGGGDKRGSLPDLKTVTAFKPMSRREAYQLSAARRDEIRRLQDLAERRRQGDVSVILGDVRVSLVCLTLMLMRVERKFNLCNSGI